MLLVAGVHLPPYKNLSVWLALATLPISIQPPLSQLLLPSMCSSSLSAMASHGFSCRIMTVAFVFSLVYSSLIVSSTAELQKLEHSIKADGSLSLLVVGDWGRKGAYNQTHVAAQVGLGMRACS